MKFTLDARAGVNLIRAYSARELIIGEQVVTHSCLISAATLITEWNLPETPELSVADLAPLLALEPQIVLWGSALHNRALPAALRAALATRGVAVEVMELGAACRTFNILAQEERRVAAALFL